MAKDLLVDKNVWKACVQNYGNVTSPKVDQTCEDNKNIQQLKKIELTARIFTRKDPAGPARS